MEKFDKLLSKSFLALKLREILTAKEINDGLAQVRETIDWHTLVEISDVKYFNHVIKSKMCQQMAHKMIETIEVATRDNVPIGREYNMKAWILSDENIMDVLLTAYMLGFNDARSRVVSFNDVGGKTL